MKKTLIIFVLIITNFNSYCQQKNKQINYLDFLKLESSQELIIPISIENKTILLKNEIEESIYKEKIKNVIPLKNLKEILLNVKTDKITVLTKSKDIILFKSDEIFAKHKNFIYSSAPEEMNQSNDEESIKERKRISDEQRLKAINIVKSKLREFEQIIYKVSNLYFDKAKMFCTLYVIESSVGNETEKLLIFKKTKNNWEFVEDILKIK